MNDSLLTANETNTGIAIPFLGRGRNDKLLTPDEVAAMLDVKISWLMDHVSRVEPIIPHIRLGKMIRFKRNDVIAWIDSLISKKPMWE
jgi:predicted DNA-binding transcriptional regulator AlpA